MCTGAEGNKNFLPYFYGCKTLFGITGDTDGDRCKISLPVLLDVSQLAQEYGYKKDPAEKMLERLSQRVKDFSEKGMGFPHEIGMFLGYPVADIRGFIENEGRKYLMIGYWKVYSNLSQARMIFKEYDRAKECAVQEYLTGKSIREISMKKKDGGR